MSELLDFEKRIEQRFANDSRTPHWTSEEAEQFMVEVGVHRQRFEHLASHVLDAAIEPRLELLASYFPTANLVKDEPARHCTCWIGYTHRVPATTKVAFAVEHDVRHEKIAICYDAHMTPRLAKFNEHDTLTLAFDEVDDTTVANWVERRLLEFLDAYLRIDRSGERPGDDTAIDPVCGMRIKREEAVGTASRCGHPYYFCSSDCQAEFTRDPTKYVQFKTM